MWLPNLKLWSSICWFCNQACDEFWHATGSNSQGKRAGPKQIVGTMQLNLIISRGELSRVLTRLNSSFVSAESIFGFPDILTEVRKQVKDTKTVILSYQIKSRSRYTDPLSNTQRADPKQFKNYKSIAEIPERSWPSTKTTAIRVAGGQISTIGSHRCPESGGVCLIGEGKGLNRLEGDWVNLVEREKTVICPRVVT